MDFQRKSDALHRISIESPLFLVCLQIFLFVYIFL